MTAVDVPGRAHVGQTRRFQIAAARHLRPRHLPGMPRLHCEAPGLDGSRISKITMEAGEQ